MQGCECTCKFSVSFLQLWKFKFKFGFNSFSFSWSNRRREICSKKKKTKEEIGSIMINDLLKMKLITNSDSSSSCNHFHFSLPTRLVSWKNSWWPKFSIILIYQCEQKQTNRPLVRPLSTVKKIFKKKKINSPNSWKNIEIKSCDSIELQ